MRADGAPSAGLVTLTPVATRDSAALNLTVVAAPVVVALDSAGKFARIVMAGNDPDLGALLYLRIDELIDGESRTYTILVPESAVATGLDLADRESLEPVQEMAGYVLLSSVGVTVAPLVGGLVPVVHLPPASGSGVTDHGLLTGLADDDHPHYLTQVRGDARYYTETESDSLLTGKAPISHAHSYQPLDSDLTNIASLAPADGSILRRVQGAWAAATLVKGDLDLGNVDNTSDAGKPISTVQQVAFALKANNSLIPHVSHSGNSLFVAGGVEAGSRLNNSGFVGTSGRVWLSYFTALVDTSVTELAVSISGDTAVGTTLARMAVHTVATNGSVAKVAQTDNDPTIGINAYTIYARVLSTVGGFPSAYTFLAGNRYAFTYLHIGTTMPSMSGAYVIDPYTLPVPCRIIDGQTDIAGSYAVADLTPFYYAVWLRAMP